MHRLIKWKRSKCTYYTYWAQLWLFLSFSSICQTDGQGNSNATLHAADNINVTVLVTTTSRPGRDIPCHPLRQALGGKSIDGIQVPARAVNGDHLKMCPQEATCCSAETENKLSVLARQDYDRLVEEHLSRLQALLVSRTGSFDDFFTGLVKRAKDNLHNMFSRTYGESYRANVAIFTELFEDLERYYKASRGAVDVGVSVKRFFGKLLYKMLVLMNPGLNFDPSHQQCISRNMDKTKPFGEAADRLTLQLRRAFAEARTFVQALAVGRDAARTASEILLTPQCNMALTRMLYCAQCRGLQNLKPCNAYCLSVMKTCLTQHMQLDSDWNRYLDAVMLLADRLKGPHGLESILSPIDVKISEAIMNLQENGIKISQAMTKECGPFRITKRSIQFPVLSSNTSRTRISPTPPTELKLEQLTRDVKDKLGATRHFWTSLASQLCTDIGKSAKGAIIDDCWNGVTKSKGLTSAISADGRKSKMVKSVDHESSSHALEDDYKLVKNMPANPIVRQTTQQLALAANRLMQAYNGTAIDPIQNASDDEDEEESLVAEARETTVNVEGSGSGDGAIDETDTDEEDDSESDSHLVEGSADRPVDRASVTSAGISTFSTNAPVRLSTPRVTVDISVHPVTPASSPADFHFEITTTTQTTSSSSTTLLPSTTTVRPLATPPKATAALLTPLHSPFSILIATAVLFSSQCL